MTFSRPLKYCHYPAHALFSTCAKLLRLIIALLVLLSISISAGAITSTFNVSRTSGCAPLVVNFTPVDPACSGCTYSWNFGTGSPVPSYTASSSFLTVGTHVVTLTVTSGTVTSTSTRTITVHPSPTVSFTADDTAFCPGGSVALANTSTNGTPGAATYKWNFGDGDTAATPNVTHSYSLSGYYNVALSVTNSQGCVTTLAKTTLIHVYNRPAVNFTPDKIALCDPPGNVIFTNTTTGSSPFTYLWKFGDNGTSGATSPTHSYTATGSYYVSLKATDVNGCVDSFTYGSYIYVGNVVAAFTAPDTVCVNSTVSFSNTSSAHSYREWQYGDGATSNTVDGTHIYTAVGTYTVTLQAAFSPCIDYAVHVVHVIGGPPGGWVQSPEQPCPAPVTIQYTSTAPPGTNVEWIMERELLGIGPYFRFGNVVSHNYQIDSVVYFMMIKTNATWGCKDTVFAKDTLYNHGHQIIPDRDRGCAPHNVNFNWQTITTMPDGLIHPYPYGVGSLTWKFDSSSATAAGNPVAHTFDSGAYTVHVTGTTGNGCVIHDSVNVWAGVEPVATFTASPLHICKTDSIAFFGNTAQGFVDSFYWDFGDYAVHTDTGYIKRIYNLPGLFTVTLTPCNNGCCGDTFVMHDYVLVDSPKAAMYTTFNCLIDKQVLFFDSSLGNDSTLWDFGDGDTSYAKYPAHTYASEGSYNIAFFAFNSTSGCIDSARHTIKVVDPHPTFIADDTTLCEQDTVWFTGDDPVTISDLQYRWWVDTLTPYGSPMPYPFIFTSPGRYTIRMLTTDDNSCVDTITKVNYVTLGKPKAGFTTSVPQGCVPLPVVFFDTSENVIGLTSAHFFWDFGDGDTLSSTATTVNHTYTAIGTYTVTEVVTNNIGCKDTTMREIIVRKATPSFFPSATNACINSVINFTNTSANQPLSQWTFGDSDTSAITSPSHSYDDTGTYTVTLSIVDTNGCIGATSMDIVVSKPQTTIAIDDSVSVCVPFLAQFYHTGTGASSYEWTFGDTHTSLVPSPTNNYTVPGIYTARLITTSSIGCKDTASMTITVYGYPGSFSYTPKTGCSPLTIHFSSSLTNVPYIAWDFADGVVTSVSTTDTISHTYITPGAYVPKLILSDSSGCVTFSAGLDTIKVSTVIPKIRAIPDTVCVGNLFTLADSSTSYFSPVMIRDWTYDGISSSATSPTHVINTAGIYPIHLMATNGWGCVGIIDTTLVVVSVDTITGNANLCVGSTTTFASTTMGGTWSSGSVGVATVSSTGVVTGIAAGTAVISYSWAGCEVTRIVSVNPLPLPITGTMSLCAGTNTLLNSATSGGVWSTSSGAISVASTSGVVSGISAGTGIVTYLAGGCFDTATLLVNISPDIITGNTTFCRTATSAFSNAVAGGIWSSSDTLVTTIASTGIASGVNPGTAIISYAIGQCKTTLQVTVNNVIPENTGIFRICTGDTTTLYNTSAGGTWSSDNTAIATIGISSGFVSGIAAGSAIITYSLGIGCTDTAVMTILPLPYPGIITGTYHVCIGHTTQLADTVTGGTWTGTNTHTTISASGLVTGNSVGKDIITYSVTDTNCASYTTQEVTVNPLPNPGNIISAGPFCMGAITTLNVTPASSGIWGSSNPGVASVDSATAVLTALSTGTTTITFIISPDANGCRDTATSILSVVPPTFTVSSEIEKVKCYDGNDGSITLSVSGTPPFAYQWWNGADTSSVSNLPAGTYSVIVTQPTSQCIVIDSFVVAQPDSFTLTADVVADTCQLRFGSINVTVTGGTSPYTYTWSDTAGRKIDNVLAFLLKGSYTLTVTDAQGCVDTASFNVLEAPCNNIVIYDVITPNGDGYNDNWVINGISGYPNNLVQVFDKWGDLVYEKYNYKNDWSGDGKSGHLLPDGTYYYVVKLNEPNKTGGETDFAGTILIKR